MARACASLSANSVINCGRAASRLAASPHALPIAVVLHGRDAFDFLFANQLRDALLQDRFLDLIRQLFGDELRAPVAGLFELDARGNQYPPAARRIRMLDVVDDQA